MSKIHNPKIAAIIKYKTQVGTQHENMEALELRDAIKPLFSGMHCSKCKQDTNIHFVDDGYNHLKYQINACCCPEFEIRIRKRIWPD